MSIFTQEYLDSYVRELNGDRAFKDAARWFVGRVAYVCGADSLWLELKNGEIAASGLGPRQDATFTLSADRVGWRELFSPETVNGTISRLYRQGKVQIDGDMVQAIFFWKMVFAMTEAGDRVPLAAAVTRRRGERGVQQFLS